nr:amidohydrolase family protein [Actinomycetota bacterium]
MTRTLLAGGADFSGAFVDVVVDDRGSGSVLSWGPPRGGEDDADARIDCCGSVVLPAPAEPHAHLDKALSGRVAPNPGGDLWGAVEAWGRYRATLTRDDLIFRATSAIEALVTSGATAIRTHVDVAPSGGLASASALIEVREEVHRRGLAHLELVALIRSPLAGDSEAAGIHRRLLDEALDLGVDVVGGCPNLDPNPDACSAVIVDTAARRGLRADVHCDETLDPGAQQLSQLATLTANHDLGGRVTASHCVSLSMQALADQEAAAASAASAGVAVITLPQTNLYLQARGMSTSPPRGLTAVGTLLEGGVTVAAGGDNARDPFCAMGRLDPVETASLLVMAGHLNPEQAWVRCCGAARTVMGLSAPSGLTVPAGEPAELLVIEGRDLSDALAAGSGQRTVIHQGRVVATTTVRRRLHDRAGATDP